MDADDAADITHCHRSAIKLEGSLEYVYDDFGGVSVWTGQALYPMRETDEAHDKAWPIIKKDIRKRYPYVSCQHEYDCCGRWYSNGATLLALRPVRGGDSEERMWLATFQGTSTQNV